MNSEFTDKGHTVIIIAHRLSALTQHTKSGRDLVALMGNGRLQEVITEIGPVTFKAFEGK